MFKSRSAKLRNLLIELGLAAAATLIALMLSLPLQPAVSSDKAASPEITTASDVRLDRSGR